MLTSFATLPSRLFANPAFEAGAYPDALKTILSHQGADEAASRIKHWPGYAPTPLVPLDTLATVIGVGAIQYKHEASRFGLGSFKALGGAYAVQRLIEARIASTTGTIPPLSALLDGTFKDVLDGMIVCCATDGNHGRSVAWGARMFGIPCVIFLHETVSKSREQAIAHYGARIIRTPGNYDDSVRSADEAARLNGWQVVSDTSYPGYVDVPRNVMQGYAIMADEAMHQRDDRPPTHVFIQGGVGGLAAAVTAHYKERYGASGPKIIVVEPDRAACLLASAINEKPTAVHGDLDTIMAGLACGEPSLIAWPILSHGVEFFLEISDEAAMETMRLLASGKFGPKLAGGESGVAGLAGLLVVAANPKMRVDIGLDATSEIVLFGSEGATDPDVYFQVVGQSASQVEAA